MTEKQLKEIEALHEAAMPGHRKVINVNADDPMEYGPFWCVTNEALDAEQDWAVEIRFGGEEDAVFDAEIYNILPELIAEVRRLQVENEKLRVASQGVRERRLCEMTTWRELITKEMQRRSDNWTRVVTATLTEKELDKTFDNHFGATEGEPFTVWTQTRVYFPVTYDGAEWCASVSRNPDGQPTGHVGGGG